MNIDYLQLDLIKKSKKYINRINQSGLDISCFSETYFISDDQPGYFILKYFIYGKRRLLHRIYIYLKSLYSIRNLSGYKIYNNNKKKKFKKIVVSWSKKNDFLDNGSYDDRYFKTNSRENKEVLWFLISIDSKFPKNLNENIIVFSRKNNNERSSLYLIKILFVNN